MASEHPRDEHSKHLVLYLGHADAPILHVDGRIRYSNAEACLDAAQAGLGIACVPSFIAGEALREGRVRRVLQDL